jgi:ABC-type nickel/cobalt efflux system permease component RcnA
LLSLTSALAQAVTAILLVALLVGGLQVLDSRDAVDLAEAWLRPLSYLLFMCIGAVLIWRGLKTLLSLTRQTTKAATGCTHSHGPSLEQLDATASWKQRVALVLSIAIRPCTGALFLLIIAARLELFWLGIIGTLAMGLGTATFNTSIAASGFLARSMVQRSHRASLVTTGAALQIAGGVLVIAVSLAFLGPIL